jgi:hypothetical protein
VLYEARVLQDSLTSTNSVTVAYEDRQKGTNESPYTITLVLDYGSNYSEIVPPILHTYFRQRYRDLKCKDIECGFEQESIDNTEGKIP